MGYIICHGEMLKDGVIDTSRRQTGIGFFVQYLGQVLLKQDSVGIILDSRPPTLVLEPSTNTRNFRLQPLQRHEFFGMREALGPRADRADIHFLQKATTLEELLGELSGEDEIRMIACTADEGAPRTAGRSEEFAGVFVDYAPPTVSRTAESDRIDREVNEFVLARENSEHRAVAVAGTVGRSAPLWVASPVTTALMVECTVRTQPAVTDDPRTWLRIMYLLSTQRPAAASLLAGAQRARFPRYGEDLMVRLRTINGFVQDWPACLPLYEELWRDTGDPAVLAAREYLMRPFDSPAVAVNTARFLASRVQPDDLPSWNRYLSCLQSFTLADRARLHTVFDTDEPLAAMTRWSTARTDYFPELWAMATTAYPAVAAHLRDAARTDARLQQFITQAEQG